MRALLRSSARPRPPLRAFARHEDASGVTLNRASIARTMSLIALRLTQVAQPSGRSALRRRGSSQLALRHSPGAAAERFEDETVARKAQLNF
jgi:hypothetical protein